MRDDPAAEFLAKNFRDDVLWRVKAYRLSTAALQLVWGDVSDLARDYRCRAIADQLHRSVASIGANIAEGYGRGGGRDRARFFEYALGSSREAKHWYIASTPRLGRDAATERIARIDEIARLLIATIREERRRPVGSF